MKSIAKYFHLDENGTTIKRELVAGLTTFFAMVYIIFVNPNILANTGMPKEAVFLATILATVIGTLVMGLFANVPYALAPGMGLNAFFTYTVCFGLGFTWQQALGLVFICGVINILITVTKIRKSIIKAIPRSLQNAIGGGIGIFIAYIGFLDVAAINFDAGVPALSAISTPALILAFIGIILTVVLLVLKVKGAILIGILATTVIGIPMGVTDLSAISFDNLGAPFQAFGTTFGACFGGIGSLFADVSKLPIALFAIFAFSLTDTFDTIGTFIGTGRASGIFSDEDLTALETSEGFKSKMDKALFADSIATSIGAVLGTSNTTTYIESAAGIEAGGRTGLTSVFTAILFLLCILLAPIFGIVPTAATAPALIVVGIMIAGNLKEIAWDDFSIAVPAFFAAVTMALTYSISIGIAFGFIFYVLVQLVKGQIKKVHPILLGAAILFVAYFVLMAVAA
jgi:AGZA family xanthine/uracil permease-like MFS transporter